MSILSLSRLKVFFPLFGLSFTCYFGNQSYHSGWQIPSLCSHWPLSLLPVWMHLPYSILRELVTGPPYGQQKPDLTYKGTMFVYTHCTCLIRQILLISRLLTLDVKLIAVAQCNWLSLSKTRHFLVLPAAVVTEWFWIHLLGPEILVTDSLPSWWLYFEKLR